MTNTIRIKRRASGNAGAPTTLENAELAYNEVDDILYYGKGTGGTNGSATTVEAIGGTGALVTKGTTQTISGDKTFSGLILIPTPTESTHATTKAYVDSAVGGVPRTFTVAGDSGSSQTITTGSDTFTVAGGTGLSSVAGSTDTITLNLDDTVVTPGSYGSASAIPTFTVDAQGRLTAAGTASISTSFTVDADSGDNLTISGGDTFAIVGGTGLTSVASATDILTLNLDNTAVTGGSYGSATAVSTFTVDAQGRLTAAGTATIAIPASAVTDFNEAAQDAVGGILSSDFSYNDSTAGIGLSYITVGNTLLTGVSGSSYGLIGTSEYLDIKDTNGYNKEIELDIAAVQTKLNTDGYITTTSASTLTNKTLTNPVVSGLTVSDSSIVFEGATADAFETTVTVSDPTADRTITLPDASGTIALVSDIPTAYVSSIEGTVNEIEVSGSTGNVTIGLPDNVSLNGNLTVGGDLTVNGSVTSINSTTITVDDKNLELASVETPTNTTANGAGITVKGATDKTISWLEATSAWTLSEHVDLAAGKSFYIGANQVLNSSTLGSGITSSSLTSLGTISVGTWQGTSVGVLYGGTGATTASAARSNLGLAIGTDVQGFDAELSAIAGLSSQADRLPYFTGTGTASLATLTSFGRSLIDDADSSTARGTLGLGTISVQNANNISITGGSISGITFDGGTF